MIYAVSNLHGNKTKFDLLLKLINFSEEKDIMYVLGDTVDYGVGGIDLLIDMSMRPNVYHILGEHEAKAYSMISRFLEISESGKTPDASFIAEFRNWTSNEGGMPTFEAFQALDADMREGILDYFAEMTPYEEVTAAKKSFVLCHAGIRGFSPERSLEDYDEEDFYTEPLDFSSEHIKGKVIVVGHKPTTEFNKGAIYQTASAINIDCACAFDGRLGCICLDTGREFYV